MATTPQLPLAIQLPDDETFTSFLSGAGQVSAERLKDFIVRTFDAENSPCFYIYGGEGVGKSHLLHAACAFAQSIELTNFCMSFSQLKELSIEILEGLENFQLICLDDIQLIAGDVQWQQAVFDLYNRVTEQGHKIVITANDSVSNLNITLPDLNSRLSWGETELVKPLSDEEKIIAVQYHGKQRGLEISVEVTRYIINHQARDMKSLIGALNKLDNASIREQRKITIPFIKEVLF
ncbi:MAG: DnaA regulatory inactivator Hda [Thalassotalea sp.]